MTQIEINIPAGLSKAFDDAFYRFLICEFDDVEDPLIQMDTVNFEDVERRVLWFECKYKADAFHRHWLVAPR